MKTRLNCAIYFHVDGTGINVNEEKTAISKPIKIDPIAKICICFMIIYSQLSLVLISAPFNVLITYNTVLNTVTIPKICLFTEITFLFYLQN